MYAKCTQVVITQSCPTLCDPTDCSPPGSSPWDSPGKNTGVDCHSLLQRIFPTQGLNPGLLHCRQILYHLSYGEVLNTHKQNFFSFNGEGIIIYISVLQLFFLTLTGGRHIFVSVKIQLLCLVNACWFNMVLTV